MAGMQKVKSRYGFLGQKYQGEMHFPGYNYMGPGTRLDYRTDKYMKPLRGEEPINKLDAAAYRHDVAYHHIVNQYNNSSIDYPSAMKKVHESDKSFIKDAAFNRDKPLLGLAAAGAIGAKMLGEKAGVLNTNTFSWIDKSKKTNNVSKLGENPLAREKNAPMQASLGAGSVPEGESLGGMPYSYGFEEGNGRKGKSSVVYDED